MTIRWMARRRWYYGFSAALILAGLGFILLGGLKPALEFTGGSQLLVKIDSTNAQSIGELSKKALAAEKIEPPTVIALADDQYELDLAALNNTQKEALLDSLRADLPDSQVEELSFQSVGPTVGKELLTKTGYAVALAVVVILAYLWLQFNDWRFGFAGVLAMLHDTFIVTGAFAALGYLLGVKVDVLFVTALLTILSFSVHDTIVLFDRYRELRRTSRASVPPEELADLAVTQTVTRSLNNSLTILIMLAALLLLGGESLRWFTTALFVGTLIGTYSSTFTALPLYVDLVRWESDK
jgi:preprotein translocase subunit SecF